jgi:hypothetical protein
MFSDVKYLDSPTLVPIGRDPLAPRFPCQHERILDIFDPRVMRHIDGLGNSVIGVFLECRLGEDMILRFKIVRRDKDVADPLRDLGHLLDRSGFRNLIQKPILLNPGVPQSL